MECPISGKQKLKRCTKLGPPTLIPFTVQFLLVLQFIKHYQYRGTIRSDTLLSPDNTLLSLVKPDSYTKTGKELACTEVTQADSTLPYVCFIPALAQSALDTNVPSLIGMEAS